MFAGAFVDKVKKNEFFGDFFTEKSVTQFKKYLITGFTYLGIEWASFVLLSEVIRLDDRIANVIVYYILIFWIVFLASKFWSFQSKSNTGTQLFYYMLLFIFNLTVGNIGIWYVLTRIIKIPGPIAKPMLQGVLTSWNFIVYKKVIYKT
ncbi:GtrA family protein [Acetivibrio straminisolvens]|jgi:putative flippase GtrA|uniref:GtrA family protein n=1 Tax=Acetivibrio straminisolvens TaxID=253314 RepID=UPI000571B0EF|nr:GtrA family protein [Acetivibrio straminisolvens]